MNQKMYSLTEQQRAVVIGTVLGDGCLVPTATKKNARLQIDHGEKQKEYVFWKYQILQSLVLKPPQFREQTRSWRFRTISHSELTDMERLFYDQRKKIVPKNIHKLIIEPLTLAVWFMDDGSKNRNDGLILNTQSFTKNETECLRECLVQNFDLCEISLQADKSGWRLYIQKNSAGLMTEIIRPFILPELMYKIISPVETTRRLPVSSLG